MKFTKSLTWLVILVVAIGFIGCSDDDDDNPADNNSMQNYFDEITEIGDAYYTGGTKNVSSAALHEALGNGEEYFIIDYRSAEHFTGVGHIDADAYQNATIVNWAAGDLMDNLDQIPDGVKVANVCYSGQTASQATSILRLLGYDAYNVLFGMCGWTADTAVNLSKWANIEPGGQPLETDANELATEIAYPQARSDAGDVDGAIMELADAYFEGGTHNVSAAAVYEANSDNDDTNDYFVVNYFPESNYLAGHIPGAYRIPSNELTKEWLKYLPTDQPVVIYCWTGQTSSQVTSYLNVLGYDAYSMLYGVNTITDDPNVNGHEYSAPGQNYPVTDPQ